MGRVLGQYQLSPCCKIDQYQQINIGHRIRVTRHKRFFADQVINFRQETFDPLFAPFSKRWDLFIVNRESEHGP